MTGANGIQWSAAKAGRTLHTNAKASKTGAGGEKTASAFAALMSANYAAGASMRTSASPAPRETAYESYPGVSRTIDTAKANPMADKLADASEELTGFAEEITAAVAEKLGVDEEQVTAVMEELGLSAFDLLDPQNLTRLAVELTGAADETELLLSPRFLDLMQTVQTMGRELMAELDLPMEQMDELIAQMDVLESPEKLPEKDFGQEIGQKPLDAVQSDVSAGVKTEVVAEEAAAVENPKADAKNQTDEDVTAAILPEEKPEETVAAVQEPDTDETVGKLPSETKPADVPKEPDAQEEPAKAAEEKPVQMQAKEGAEHEPQSFERKEEHEAERFGSRSGFGADTPTVAVNEPTAGIQSVLSEAGAEMPAVEGAYVSAETIDMIDQVAEKLKVTISEGLSSMEMTLNPENLGKVYLQISSREGAVHAQIAAANEAVKNALESQVAQIQENLNQAGVKVEAIEVTVASHEFERNLEQNQKREEQEGERAQEHAGRRRNLNLSSLDELSGMMSEEEALVAQIMRENGNSVDLTA